MVEEDRLMHILVDDMEGCGGWYAGGVDDDMEGEWMMIWRGSGG